MVIHCNSLKASMRAKHFCTSTTAESRAQKIKYTIYERGGHFNIQI